MLSDLLGGVLSDLRYRLRAIFRRAAVERELAEELEMHLALETERHLRAGLAPDEARRRARLAFGGVERVKDESRDARGIGAVELVRRDLGHALRLARRQPGVAAVVALSLALGLGATITVFNLAFNILLAPLPLPRPEELVAVTRLDDDGGRDYAFTRAEYLALRETPGVASFAAYRGASQVSIVAGDAREFINLDLVDGELFPLLGLRALHGRLLTPEDDARRAPVVVLSERLARRLFAGGASSAVGRTVVLRGSEFTVVGVTPRSFLGVQHPGLFTAAVPQSADALLALPANGFSMQARDAYIVVGRRAVEHDVAAAALASTFRRCCADAVSPTGARGRRLGLLDIRGGLPNQKRDLRADSRAMLVMLFAGMALVLVVVCCNIAGLLLVRGAARQREIAVRMSLGASRRRVVGQLVLENVPAAVAGGAGGLLLAAWGTAAFIRQLPPDWDEIAELARFRTGAATLAFAGAATLACALAFAVYPALRATRFSSVVHALRGGLRASRTRAQGAIARGVVVAQMAVTVVLVTATALLAATLGNLSRADGGFATERVLLASLETRSTDYERSGVVPLIGEIGRRVRAIPGVRQSVMATQVPLYGGTNAFTRLGVPGAPPPPADNGRPPSARFVGVEPGYFAASGIRLLSGRDFAESDGATGEPVAIASAAFVREHFAGRDALGRSVSLGADSGLTIVRIVGVADDARYLDLRTPGPPMLYRPLAQLRGTWRIGQLWIRTEGDPMRAAPAVLRAIEGAAPGIQVRRVRDMATHRDAALAPERLAARLAAFVSVMALVLAAVGLYGVVAFGVQRRTTEIGVRLALGARAPAIIWLVARETVLLVGLGVLIGGALSFAATGAMASQLFGIGAHDPLVAGGSVLLLAVAALVSSALPARRAMRIEPRIALSAD